MADLFATGYRYHYSQLPQHMKAIYTNVYNGLKARRADFTFTVEKHNGLYPNKDIVGSIITCVLLDNPSLYYVDIANLLINSDIHFSGKVRVTYTEYYTPAQSMQIEQQLRQRAEPIVDYLRTQSAGYPRLYDLYRYVIATIHGDHSVTKTNTQKNLEARTIVGPLLHGTGVCGGYSKVFKLLCDQLGIGCIALNGKGNSGGEWAGHSWNIVILNGCFYHVDLTYDSAYFHASGKYTYDYYLRSDDSMQKDHRWDRSKYPAMVNDFAQ